MQHANYSLLVVLVPAHGEPKVKAQVDPTEEANPKPKPKQGKPQCNTTLSLIFILNNMFMLRMIVH
jgi:hypothetical protein